MIVQNGWPVASCQQNGSFAPPLLRLIDLITDIMWIFRWTSANGIVSLVPLRDQPSCEKMRVFALVGRKLRLNSVRTRAAFFASLTFFGFSSHTFASLLRVVDWNIEADINGVTTPRAGMNTVLQGMGNEIIAGNAQPIDIMALEETTSNTTTVQPILNMLNGDYVGANYQMSSFQAGESGNDPTTGNGPNAIIFNANTVTLLASVGVGSPAGSSNGEYRQVMRYEFEPIGSASPFYVYVSHMKSGTTAADAVARGKEATIIRNNESQLPANSSVIYTGDLNSAPPEAEFTNFTAAGQGQAFDPANFSTSGLYYSDASTSLRFRDDYQLMTQDILNDTGPINYVNGSLHSFGNNGSVTSGSVNSASNSDLNYMSTANGYNPTRAQILSALTTASDHLPNVADYSFVVPEPTCLMLIACASGGLLLRRPRCSTVTA
jgi:endonuclease/exonuclease/phosphatase family metal-dependent hydrolase